MVIWNSFVAEEEKGGGGKDWGERTPRRFAPSGPTLPTGLRLRGCADFDEFPRVKSRYGPLLPCFRDTS